MPRLWMVPAALFSAALALLLLPAGPTAAAPAPVVKRPKVEVLFCIDTTGSMSSFLEGSKTKIWSICNHILNGKPSPELTVALVNYRDRGDSFITKVFDLRDDLDAVYSDLKAFDANEGGDEPESVNQALDDAVNKIKWSEDKRVLKFIFLIGDAHPHMDYADDVKYPVTCQKAMDKGIVINAIQCGDAAECTKYWKDIAEKGGGAYAKIPSSGGVKAFSTPQDKRLQEINQALLKSILVFGDAAKRDADKKKIQTALTLPAEVAADRAGYMSKEGRVAPYDLLDTIRSGKMKLATLKAEELPEELRELDGKGRADLLDKVAAERGKLLREAADLNKLRVEALRKELDANKDSFDNQVLDMLRKQSAKRIKY
ncbi:MAG: VWA domain-containing protein [Gemmataceae bacterium]|nr:VWA domain-containing protein [Gemmataceae bacterium]